MTAVELDSHSRLNIFIVLQLTYLLQNGVSDRCPILLVSVVYVVSGIAHTSVQPGKLFLRRKCLVFRIMRVL